MPKFQVFHAISGNKMTEVTVPDDVAIPDNLAEMSTTEYDEWLYSVQSSSSLQWEDISHAEAVSIVRID